MADDLEKQANAAFLDDDYELAVDLFSQAISASPSNASLLVSRAQAHIKLLNFTDAVADANRAIELNPSLLKAYLRKGAACFSLEEYQTAKSAFVAGAELEPSNSTFKKWIKKCDVALAEEVASDGQQPAETNLPNVSTGLNIHDGVPPIVYESVCSKTTLPASQSETLSPASSPAVSDPSAKQTPKFRHAFYQNSKEVVVEIFAKGLKSKDVKIEFGVQYLSLEIKTSDDPYIFQSRLNQKILIDQCKYNILSTKIEVRLAKAEMLQWKTLEYNQNQTTLQAQPTPSDVTETKLEYPSSSKKPYKDWDKLEAEVKKEEKDEKLEGDAALNKLFRDIYQSADEDTRRAMNKSFVESSGTVLSTNWKEVGSKYVAGSPPSGMEMKQWEH